MDTIFEDFTIEQRQIILKRDGYKCVVCGYGKREGVELHIDHIKPKDKGGKSTIENGQVLCLEHYLLKKNLSQTEIGKKMFLRLYEVAKKENNQEFIDFCVQILETFEKHNINGHIKWNR